MRNVLASVIRSRWRALVGFALTFRLLEGILLAPLAAGIGKLLLGRTVVDSTAIVGFLLSFRGALSLLLAAVIAISIRLIEHAGLSVIIFGAFENRRITAGEALSMVLTRASVLLRVAARIVLIFVIVLLPLLLVAGGFAAWLLPAHDVNYYLKLKPPEFVLAATVICIVGLATGAVALLLWVRWRWVVQVVMFESRDAREAFIRSASITRGVRSNIASACFLVALLGLVLGVAGSTIGDLGSAALLGIVGTSVPSLAITFGVLLLFRVVVGALFTLLGSFVDAGVFTGMYRWRSEQTGGAAMLPKERLVSFLHVPRLVPAALLLFLVGLALTGTWFALHAISDQRPVTIHAHRGVTDKAPENTLAAAKAAIAAGADYLELDVQLSRDGVLVVAHDSDFSRTGGVAKRVWELTYDEIRAIPLGADSAPEFRGEVVPDFDSLLAATKDRIKLNIELKYYGDHQPQLARKVVEAVRARGMLGQVIIQCLEYEPLMEVKTLAPAVPVGYLLSVNAREASRLDVAFLSVEQRRLDRRFIAEAHRRGQQVYAWTVNTVEDMERLLDLGIDGVITDQTALARETVKRYLARPQSERALQRVKAWLE